MLLNRINHCTEDHLCKIEKTLNSEILNILEDKDLNSDLDKFEKLREIKDLINRLRMLNEENQNIHLIVVVGAVKSGKSTLINLLAGTYISPTGSLETTKCPSIIAQIPTNKDMKPGYVRLIKTGDEDNNKKKDSERISKVINNIKKYGCLDKAQDEELLGLDRIDDFANESDVILNKIYVKGNEEGTLLSENIFIVDMPGFDGREVNYENSHYETILRQADFVIYVHASTSDMNVNSIYLFEKLNKYNPNVPVCILINYYDCAYWLSKETKDKKKNEHLNQCIKELRKLFFFKEIPNQEERTINVVSNLGLISDYKKNLIDEKWKVYIEEEINNENNIFNDKIEEIYNAIVNNNRMVIRNRVSKLYLAIDRIKENVDLEIERYSDVNKKEEEILIKINAKKIENEIKIINEDEIKQSIENILKLIIDGKTKDYVSIVNKNYPDELKKYIKENNSEIPKPIYNELFKKCYDELKEEDKNIKDNDRPSSYINRLNGPFWIKTAKGHLKEIFELYQKRTTNYLAKTIRNTIVEIIKIKHEEIMGLLHDKNYVFSTNGNEDNKVINKYKFKEDNSSIKLTYTKEFFKHYDISKINLGWFFAIKNDLRKGAQSIFVDLFEVPNGKIYTSDFIKNYMKDSLEYYGILMNDIVKFYVDEIKKVNKCDDNEIKLLDKIKNKIEYIKSATNQIIET